MGKPRFALQLYTVRDHLDQDVPGTLDKVKDIGYNYVEVGGTHGLSNAEFKKLLDAAGLKPISTHVGYDQAAADTASVVETARIFGVEYVVVGGIDRRLTPDRQGWIACGKALDAGGARLREAGIHLCYHNHAHEFQAIGSEYPFDLLFGAADPRNLAAQIDTFWVRYADLNPVTVINKYAGRCPLLHVKDMADTKSRAFAEVGTGILDWPGIFAAAEAAGTQWYIVEQDTCPTDSMASAAISAQFMVKP
jgi:sugar phosphate isomerase/epimerase